MPDPIERRADFGLVRYANCWEDADVLCEALRPLPGRRILSVASGGDNSFALAAGGAEVVAADISPAQLACVELKRAALRHLDHNALLAFLGVFDTDDRIATYGRLKADLAPAARAFWDERPADLAGGIIHAGKFEHYFRLLRRYVLPLVHTKKTIGRLLDPKDEPERRRFYESEWNNVWWRVMFRLFFSRITMGRLGRDPEFFRYVEGSVSERILSRVRHALTALPTHSNPYLRYILTGNFAGALPRYLRPENFDAVRGGLDRLTTFHGSIEEAAGVHGDGGFDGFNLSDIFEYLSPETCENIYGKLLDAARPHARLAYWNMLVRRRCPHEFDNRVRTLDELSQELFAKDLAFFYRALVVEEVAP
jgi:S-adenosylmethionine-diacylglycerol 3-amino-3-carboxypropyl transferase